MIIWSEHSVLLAQQPVIFVTFCFQFYKDFSSMRGRQGSLGGGAKSPKIRRGRLRSDTYGVQNYLAVSWHFAGGLQDPHLRIQIFGWPPP